MKNRLIFFMSVAVFSTRLSGGSGFSCCCNKTDFEKQPTRQIAALVRTDTYHLKKVMHSSSSKARRIKKRATIELNKHNRTNSREEIERERKEQEALAAERQARFVAERIAERQKRRAFEKTRKASDLKDEKTDSKEESKSNKSLVLEDLQ